MSIILDNVNQIFQEDSREKQIQQKPGQRHQSNLTVNQGRGQGQEIWRNAQCNATVTIATATGKLAKNGLESCVLKERIMQQKNVRVRSQGVRALVLQEELFCPSQFFFICVVTRQCSPIGNRTLMCYLQPIDNITVNFTSNLLCISNVLVQISCLYL